MTIRAGIPVGVHVSLFRPEDGAILLLRRAGTGFFDGQYSLPGGHVEEGESLCGAARREIHEEIGLDLFASDLCYQGVVHRRSDSNRIDFFFRARCWRGTPHIHEVHKCDALDWFAPTDLPENTVTYVRAALSASDPPWFLELGW